MTRTLPRPKALLIVPLLLTCSGAAAHDASPRWELAAGPSAAPEGEPALERCSITILRDNPEGYFYPLEHIEGFVDGADVIVRAVAVNGEEGEGSRDRVRFGVVESFRGSPTSEELAFPGRLVERNDFNRGEVPYRIVRPAGQRGDCFAREYRIGAEYLFLLREREEGLTPHWAPLAPTNEQIRGEDDPWVVWVRGRL